MIISYNIRLDDVNRDFLDAATIILEQQGLSLEQAFNYFLLLVKAGKIDFEQVKIMMMAINQSQGVVHTPVAPTTPPQAMVMPTMPNTAVGLATNTQATPTPPPTPAFEQTHQTQETAYAVQTPPQNTVQAQPQAAPQTSLPSHEITQDAPTPTPTTAQAEQPTQAPPPPQASQTQTAHQATNPPIVEAKPKQDIEQKIVHSQEPDGMGQAVLKTPSAPSQTEQAQVATQSSAEEGMGNLGGLVIDLGMEGAETTQPLPKAETVQPQHPTESTSTAQTPQEPKVEQVKTTPVVPPQSTQSTPAPQKQAPQAKKTKTSFSLYGDNNYTGKGKDDRDWGDIEGEQDGVAFEDSPVEEGFSPV